MTWVTAVLEIIKGFFAAIPYFDKWFGKTPIEKERKRITDELKEHRDNAKEIGDAIKKAKRGDTSGIRDIIND